MDRRTPSRSAFLTTPAIEPRIPRNTETRPQYRPSKSFCYWIGDLQIKLPTLKESR
jgi:hypothetical protein